MRGVDAHAPNCHRERWLRLAFSLSAGRWLLTFRVRVILVLCSVWWLAGVILCGERERRLSAQRHEQLMIDLHDMSVPPVLSERMKDPDWSIAKWMGVERKARPCIAADELMDNNAVSRTTTRRSRRGRTRRYTVHLTE